MTPEDRKTLIAVADHLDDIAPGAAHAASLRVIASRPLTVADLLPLVDATHEVRWVATTGEEMRYHHENGCEYLRSRDYRWGLSSLNRHDLTQSATLVEVEP